MATRPEPTIIGNCDGWTCIVGKKPSLQTPHQCTLGSLPQCNRSLMHNLFTEQHCLSGQDVVELGAAAHKTGYPTRWLQ